MNTKGNGTTSKAVAPFDKFKEFARSEMIVARFAEVLGDRGAQVYINSVVLAVANSDALQACSTASIISSALRAATLSLSVDPAIGQAYLVPFGKTATFQIGYKGLRDMAVRTNKYRFLNVSPVHEGERIEFNRITGAAEFVGDKLSDKVAGWVASFELINSFSKVIYMSRDEIHEHAKKYSKGYDNPKGVWKTNESQMERKTVLRLLLLHWGTLEARDQLFISMSEDPEDESILDAQFKEFTPTEKEPQTEAQLLGDMGFSTPLPPAPPAPASHPPEPEELADKSVTGWPTDWIGAVVDAGLVKVSYHAVNRFNKSKVLGTHRDLPSDVVVSWMAGYNAARESGQGTDGAILAADAGLVELIKFAGKEASEF